MARLGSMTPDSNVATPQDHESVKVPFVVCTLSGTTISGVKLGAVNFIDATATAATYIADIAEQLASFTGKTWFVIKSTSALSSTRKVSIRNGATVLADIPVPQGVAFAETVINDGVYIGSDASTSKIKQLVVMGTAVNPDANGMANVTGLVKSIVLNNGTALIPDSTGKVSITVVEFGSIGTFPASNPSSGNPSPFAGAAPSNYYLMLSGKGTYYADIPDDATGSVLLYVYLNVGANLVLFLRNPTSNQINVTFSGPMAAGNGSVTVPAKDIISNQPWCSRIEVISIGKTFHVFHTSASALGGNGVP